MSERDELEKAIANLEQQRAFLGDAAVDAAVAGIKMQLASLDATAESQGQRKQVTVLFADLSGFTALSETMDAEDVREMVNALWSDVDKIIIDHNGHIDKHIGDAVMAIWGSEVVREDDPEQAIRAALAMQAAITTFASVNDVSLAMHIGLNTGPVFLGEVGTTGEFTAMGDTVNTASRLEDAAPSSGILISHDTYRHVRGVFDVQTQNPLVVKGKSKSLKVYLVKQAKPRAFRMGSRGIEGIETKTVGRDLELKQLIASYEVATAERRTTAVTVVGEAGVGKSRILYEFEKWLDLHPELIRYFKGRASQQSRGIPQHLLRTVLAARFQILESDTIETLREKFVAGVAEFMPDDAEMKASILGSWLGYGFSGSSFLKLIKADPEQIKNRATLYLSQLIAAVGRQGPAVILLEDIHWADGGSLGALVELTQREPDLPLLIVALARPSLYEQRPTWGEQMPIHSRLDLYPLTDAASRALVAELLHPIDPLPEALHNLIASRSEGNPFYAEELVKMLVDDGVIIKQREDHWHIAPLRYQEVKVPPTLTGVLQARLDKLQPAEKQALQQASVIGRVFWDEALATLSPEGPQALSSLQAKELIFSRTPSAFAGAGEYIFKHSILRDVTYETVLKRVGRSYHELVAEWLVTAAETNRRLDEYAARIGDHFRLAEDNGRAAPWYTRAGLQAAAIFAHEEAAYYLSYALDFTGEEKLRARFDLLRAREKAYDLQGRREEQQGDLEQLAMIAADLGLAEQVQIALRQAHFALYTSDYTSAAAHAQAAIDRAHPHEDKSLAAAGYWALGSALWQQGQYSAAILKLRKGLQLAAQADDQEHMANCLNRLGTVYIELGDLTTAIDYLKRALVIWQAIGDQRGESQVLNNLGNIQGVSIPARKHIEQALTIMREIGDRRGEGTSLNSLGFIAYRQGDYAAAEKYFHQGLKISQETGDRWGEAIVLINLGHLDFHAGNFGEAARYFDRALAISQDIGSRWLEGISLHELAALALGQEDPVLAETYYQQALTIRHDLNQTHLLFEDWAGLAKVSFMQNDRQRALRYARMVIDYLKGKPDLLKAEDPIRAFRFTWEALCALDQDEEAQLVLGLAAQIIQEYLDQNSDPAIQIMYIRQPHHQMLWQAWLGRSEEKS